MSDLCEFEGCESQAVMMAGGFIVCLEHGEYIKEHRKDDYEKGREVRGDTKWR